MTTNDPIPALSHYGSLNPNREPDHTYAPEGWGVRYFEWVLRPDEVKVHNIAVDHQREDGTWAHAQARYEADARLWIVNRITTLKLEWQEHVTRYAVEGDEPSHVRAGHVTYSIGKEPHPDDLRNERSFYGYGGRGWTVHWLDGRTPNTTITHNLWHGSTIPPILWEELPDNATLEQHQPHYMRNI
jgi:hypothetical protein